jgi:Ca2+-binding EF-hand superfamily protein
MPLAAPVLHRQFAQPGPLIRPPLFDKAKTMPLPVLILTLAAAVQAPPQKHVSRTFISPMGEPFRVGNSGEDGLSAWFHQADSNHDGALTLDEMKADAQRFFLTLDRGHDGEIDPDDLEYYEGTVAPEVRSGVSWSGVTGDRVNDEATGAGGLGLLSIPEPVAAADSNFNRGVSSTEFEQAAVSRFRRLDTNGDGKLTLDELEARREAIRSNARKPLPSKELPTAPEMPDSNVPNL